MNLKPGLRLRSTVCDGQVIVVKAPDGVDIDLRCGGLPMVSADDATRSSGQLIHSERSLQIGKRYNDTALDVQVLCTRGGDGHLSIGDEPLEQQDARALPASD